MFKYILVPATGSDADQPVFRTAVALARLHNAHLVFLHVRLDVQRLIVPMASAEYGGGAGIGEIIESLEQDTLARHDRAKAAVHALCAVEKIPLSTTIGASGPTAEWREETGEEPARLVVHGRTADLLVLGRERDEKSAPLDVLDAAVMETGRPLLLVPPHPPAQLGQTIAVAWKDTAEAATAVAAALPLLAGARRVVILSVTEDPNADPASCERLRQALVWHNRAVTVQHVAPEDRDPADALLKTAGDIGADLLVMGGYGHSRMRQIVFGGFTRRVLQVADLPVLMAH